MEYEFCICYLMGKKRVIVHIEDVFHYVFGLNLGGSVSVYRGGLDLTSRLTADQAALVTTGRELEVLVWRSTGDVIESDVWRVFFGAAESCLFCYLTAVFGWNCFINGGWGLLLKKHLLDHVRLEFIKVIWVCTICGDARLLMSRITEAWSFGSSFCIL